MAPPVISWMAYLRHVLDMERHDLARVCGLVKINPLTPTAKGAGGLMSGFLEVTATPHARGGHSDGMRMGPLTNKSHT